MLYSYIFCKKNTWQYVILIKINDNNYKYIGHVLNIDINRKYNSGKTGTYHYFIGT